MRFKNDKQAKDFLANYKSWAKMSEDEYFDRKRYTIVFKDLKIIAEETLYMGAEYNPETRQLAPMPKTILQYYVIPSGEKKFPMYSYRESMSRTVELIRKAEEGEDD